MSETHKCKEMELTEAWITCSSGDSHLNINRVATEEDLEENHYLEEVGQIIELVSLQIRYCPYCGALVDGAESQFLPAFTHHDLSRWR